MSDASALPSASAVCLWFLTAWSLRLFHPPNVLHGSARRRHNGPYHCPALRSTTASPFPGHRFPLSAVFQIISDVRCASLNLARPFRPRLLLGVPECCRFRSYNSRALHRSQRLRHLASDVRERFQQPQPVWTRVACSRLNSLQTITALCRFACAACSSREGMSARRGKLTHELFPSAFVHTL